MTQQFPGNFSKQPKSKQTLTRKVQSILRRCRPISVAPICFEITRLAFGQDFFQNVGGKSVEYAEEDEDVIFIFSFQFSRSKAQADLDFQRWKCSGKL